MGSNFNSLLSGQKMRFAIWRAGIAVNSLGHANPDLVAALNAQVSDVADAPELA